MTSFTTICFTERIIALWYHTAFSEVIRWNSSNLLCLSRQDVQIQLCAQYKLHGLFLRCSRCGVNYNPCFKKITVSFPLFESRIVIRNTHFTGFSYFSVRQREKKIIWASVLIYPSTNPFSFPLLRWAKRRCSAPILWLGGQESERPLC